MIVPDVSVIVPVYNTQEYIHRCLDSILAQKNVCIEIVAVNDGSTDSSGRILDLYQARYDNVRVLHQDNKGQGVARNRAMSEAQGKYLYFVDSDDHLSPEIIGGLLRASERHRLELCAASIPTRYYHRPFSRISTLAARMQFVRTALVDRFSIEQPAASSGQDGVFGFLLLCHASAIGVSTTGRYYYTVDRMNSTFATHRNRPEIVGTLISQHLDHISAHFDRHDLWEREAPRALQFLVDETMRNRLFPHHGNIDIEEFGRIHSCLQEFIERIPVQRKNRLLSSVHPILQAIQNRSTKDLYALLPRFMKVDIMANDRAHVLSLDESTMVVRRTPSGSFAGKPALEDSVIGRIDYLIATENNNHAELRQSLADAPFVHRAGSADIIVSMTTIKKRLHSVHLAVESIFRQTLPPEAIILWIDDTLDFDLCAYPRLKRCVDAGLEIRRVRDIGPHTKLIPALEAFPDKTIVTFDDDILYPATALESLAAGAQLVPGAVCGNWVRRMTFGKDGRVGKIRDGELMTQPFRQHDLEASHSSAAVGDMLNLAYGTGGVLYPPGCLDERVIDIQLAQELCPTEDDVWFKAMSILRGSSVVACGIGMNPKHHLVMDSQGVTLRHENHVEGGNHRALNAVFDYFDLYAALGFDRPEAVR